MSNAMFVAAKDAVIMLISLVHSSDFILDIDGETGYLLHFEVGALAARAGQDIITHT
jgi:hypothetical protein